MSVHRLPDRGGALPPVERLRAALHEAADAFADAITALARGEERERPRDGEPSGTPGRTLTVKEAAQRLGISAPTLYRNAARYPFARRTTPGRRGALRFDEQHLERWLAQHRP